MSEKKIPIDSTWAEFWNVVIMPEPGPAVLGGQAVHHRGPVGRHEQAVAQPHEQEQGGEHPVAEVDRQQLEQEEGERPCSSMPPVAKGRAP